MKRLNDMRMSMTAAVLILVSGAASAERHDPTTTSRQTPVTVPQTTTQAPGPTVGGRRAQADATVGVPPPASSHASLTAKKSKARRKQTNVSRIPTIGDTRVGYIEEAIVGSQIRVRFDAAFHDNSSDLAEFFYAQYAGINGPGPNFVIQDLNFQQLYIDGEYAPKKSTRFSFFGEVPVRWIQPEVTVAAAVGDPHNVDMAGLSDVSAGFKWAAVASPNQYFTLQLKASFPSGNASEALGTNHYSIEPALLYFYGFSNGVALEAQAGDSHPIGGSSCQGVTSPAFPAAVCVSDDNPGSKSVNFAGDVFFYGFGPSYAVYQGKRVKVAPVIELVGWRVLNGLVTVNVNTRPESTQEALNVADTNIVNLKAGVRTSIGDHSSFYLGGGYALTHSHWYSGIVRAEYRYTF